MQLLIVAKIDIQKRINITFSLVILLVSKNYLSKQYFLIEIVYIKIIKNLLFYKNKISLNICKMYYIKI